MFSKFLFVGLVFVGYYGIINPLIIGACLLIVYQLPKCVFVRGLEWLFPAVLTRTQIKNSNSNTKKIALTFDDGPTADFESLVKKLDAYDMKATFYIISSYVTEENRSLLINAVKNGHQLGNHGKTDCAHIMLSTKDLNNEIDECDKLIKSIYEDSKISLPTLMSYRPGCGSFTPNMIKIATNKKYSLTLGSVHPFDPLIRSSFLNHHYLINHIEDGDIVILHDRSWTLPTMDMFLPYLKKNN